MSAAELARQMAVPTNRVTQILNGMRAITGDSALRLAHFFGTSPQFWLNLQSLYNLRLAQEKAGKSIKVLPRLKRHEPVHARRFQMNASRNADPRNDEAIHGRVTTVSATNGLAELPTVVPGRDHLGGYSRAPKITLDEFAPILVQ